MAAALSTSPPAGMAPQVDRLGQVPVVMAPVSPEAAGPGAPPPRPPAELPPSGSDGDGDGGDSAATLWSRLDLFSR